MSGATLYQAKYYDGRFLTRGIVGCNYYMLETGLHMDACTVCETDLSEKFVANLYISVVHMYPLICV